MAERDYRTLLEMGWTPDSVSEAVEIAGDLLRGGDADSALAAVERAREITGTVGADASELVALDAMAFEVALRRADAPRAIAAANALRLAPDGLRGAELARLRGLLGECGGFRPELREALGRVLDAAESAQRESVLLDDVEIGPGTGAVEPGEDDGADELPYLDADPAFLSPSSTGVVSGGDADLGDDAWLDLAQPVAEVADWSFGAFPVGEDESLVELRERFMEAATHAATDHARQACETGWSFFLMEDFAAAAVLFDQSLGDPDVRVAAAEGLVRCHLNLSQPGQAVDFLDRLRTVCFTGGLPEPLRYWYGRAAEAGGEVRKARAAYRSVSTAAFPDVPGRLAALP